MNSTSAKKELIEKINEGYPALSKWIIGLSTGAIFFSLNLIKPETHIGWKHLLLIGLSMLVVSIVSGVRYVRISLDYATYNLERILRKEHATSLMPLDQEREMLFEGVQTKVKDIIQQVDAGKSTKKMKAIQGQQRVLSVLQQWLFYAGIILMTIFVIFGA